MRTNLDEHSNPFARSISPTAPANDKSRQTPAIHRAFCMLARCAHGDTLRNPLGLESVRVFVYGFPVGA